jgi:hypothetical protein
MLTNANTPQDAGSREFDVCLDLFKIAVLHLRNCVGESQAPERRAPSSEVLPFDQLDHITVKTPVRSIILWGKERLRGGGFRKC